MQAAVLFEPGKPLEVEDLDLAPPQEDEIVVGMAASGVCHSCLHTADGSWTGFPMPIVLGDEGAGVVEEVGSDVKHLKSWRSRHSVVATDLRSVSLLCNRTLAPLRAEGACAWQTV